MGNNMGKRPWIVPVELPETDQFGLPNCWLLIETDEQKSRRVARLQELIAEVFEKAVDHVGEDQARNFFLRVTKRPKGKHGKRTTCSPDRDRILLDAYDNAAGKTPGDKSSLPKIVGRRLWEELGTEISVSAEGAEKKLRRLLNDRKKKAAQAVADFQRWLEDYKALMGDYPTPTLLELATSASSSDRR
jgi:hypothetical protein